MPHGDKNKTWAPVSLTAAQAKFVNRVWKSVSNSKSDFARLAVLNMASQLLNEPAPGVAPIQLKAPEPRTLDEVLDLIATDSRAGGIALGNLIDARMKKKAEPAS